jgi:hypothetical protein
MTENWREMWAEQSHSKSGHVNIFCFLKFEWKIKELNEVCTFEGFQIANAKILAIDKESRNKSTIVKERMLAEKRYSYQSNRNRTSYYWLNIEDETTSTK